MAAGSGNATLLGNGGNNYFTTGSGKTSGGAGSTDTFVGGAGFDAMDAAGAKSAIFQFDSATGGGTHVIQSFDSVHDKLHLVGYDTKQVLAGARVVGGSTILTLSDHTTITLQGFSGLNAKDFS